MCKEDVRLGRAKSDYRSGSFSATAAAAGEIVGQNANRAALAIGIATGDPTVPHTVLVRSGSASGPVLVVLEIRAPYQLLRLEDFGAALTGPLFYSVVVGTDDTVFWTEVAFTEPLDKI